MGMLLLLGAARIIFPIIWAEGIMAVFFPRLAVKPLERTKAMQRIASASHLAQNPR